MHRSSSHGIPHPAQALVAVPECGVAWEDWRGRRRTWPAGVGITGDRLRPRSSSAPTGRPACGAPSPPAAVPPPSPGPRAPGAGRVRSAHQRDPPPEPRAAQDLGIERAHAEVDGLDAPGARETDRLVDQVVEVGGPAMLLLPERRESAVQHVARGQVEAGAGELASLPGEHGVDSGDRPLGNAAEPAWRQLGSRPLRRRYAAR